MFRSRLLAAALGICARRCRIAGAGAGAVLQGQAAHAAGQLRRRLRHRHRRPRVRAALRQAHRRRAATDHPEHAGRRRRQRHACISARSRPRTARWWASSPPPPGISPPSRSASASTSRPTSTSATPAAPRSTTCARTCRRASSRPTDIVKAKGLVSGGVNARTGRDISIRLTLDMLGVPFRHVTGYRQRRACAARAAAAGDPSLCRHDARLSRRGGGDAGEGRHRDPALVRPEMGRQDLRQVEAGRRAADQGLPRGLPGDHRQDAVRRAVGGISRARSR